MLKCASVYTYEVDSPDIALSEIRKQLDQKITLLDNTIGIIMCNTEFITTGVLKHICKNLPFDIAGTTTASQAVNEEAGELILTVFVMTSDDIRFRAGVTDSLISNTYDRTKAAYERAAGDETEQPELAIVFTPFLVNYHSGDEYVKAWSSIIPGTPVFGTVTTDDTAMFSECETIFNGTSTREAMPFILCYGNINPRFLIATLPEDNVISLRGKITKAKDNNVSEIDGVPARSFFSDAGIPDMAITIPLLVSSSEAGLDDDVPVIRGLYAYSDDGTGIFAGDVEEGSIFSLLSIDADSIKSALRSEVEQIKNTRDVNGAIVFSCASRRIALLGVNEDLAEPQIVKDTLGNDIPFIMGYSGGEICPVMVSNGKLVNRFHNYSAVALLI